MAPKKRPINRDDYVKGSGFKSIDEFNDAMRKSIKEWSQRRAIELEAYYRGTVRIEMRLTDRVCFPPLFCGDNY